MTFATRHCCPTCGQVRSGRPNVEIDFYGGRVKYADDQVRLSAKQLLILNKLLSAYPNGVSFENMIDALWSDPAELVHAEGTMWSHISKMRKAFAEKQWPIVISSQRNLGYRLDLKKVEPA